MASTLNEHNGIGSFMFETPEDDEDMQHDIVDVYALPGWGPSPRTFVRRYESSTGKRPAGR
jgi:hypothetical protein